MPSFPRSLPGPALAAASVALLALGLEAACRLLGVSVGSVHINRHTVQRSANPLLGFELRPGSVARAEVDYRINREGLRGPEVDRAKPGRVKRIAVLGDSIAFGYWVAEEQAFPRQLERMLGEGVEVLNFGVPGYNLDQELETLRARALAYSPDVVILALCLNDLEGIFSYEFGLVEDRSARAARPGGRILESLLRRSVLAAWVEYRLTELEARRRFTLSRLRGGTRSRREALDVERAAFGMRFGALRDILSSRGVPALVVVFPTFGTEFAEYPFREEHRVVVESAAAAGIPTVDLLPCFAGYELSDVRVDLVHPSPMGHRVAAHAVRDALCARGLLCSGAPAPGKPCTAYRVQDFPRVRGY